MKELTFPEIGLNLKINNIAISILGIEIYWYAIFIVLAIAISILFCKKDNNKYGIQFEYILELFIIVIPISIICARLYYVLFKFEYYINNPIQILNIRNGGLAIYGGIIGGVITIAFFCKIKKINTIDVLDYIGPYLPLGQAIGRWGNFFNVEAYGTETTNLLRMGIIENGIYKEVHPTFLYESISCFMIFILLYILRNKRKYRGQIIFIYLALYGLTRTLIEGLRIDSLMIWNLKISQIISIIIFLISIFILIFNFFSRKF